jgi:hypothetical protein
MKMQYRRERLEISSRSAVNIKNNDSYHGKPTNGMISYPENNRSCGLMISWTD